MGSQSDHVCLGSWVRAREFTARWSARLLDAPYIYRPNLQEQPIEVGRSGSERRRVPLYMPRRYSMRTLKRAGLVLLGILPVAVALGFVVQVRADARALAASPPPGLFADVDGHRLHYRVAGAGEATFVLEGGLGEYSGSWGGLDTLLAALGRVFVYDRAGYGWSESGPRPRTAQQIVSELHRLLEVADVPGPYVLVGHSLGGATQTLYAMRHPEQVAGVLLIDPSHRDQIERLPAPPLLEALIGTQLPRTAPFGLAGLLFGSTDPMRNRARHIATFGAELRAVERSVELWDQPIELGSMPVYVLTAGDFDSWPGETETEQRASWEIWRTMHAELVASSSSDVRRHIVVEDAGHYIHEDDPDAVVDAARDLLAGIRGGALDQ